MGHFTGKKTAKVLQEHAKLRALQRYKVDLTNADINNIVSIIQSNSREYFIEKQSNTRSRYILPYNGKLYHCIYDKPRKTIITFLPIEKQI